MDNQRSLKEIAEEIIRDWNPPHYYSARPYLDAMRTMDSIDDMYGADTGTSIVAYFICYASLWHGPTASRVKKELNSMLASTRLQPGEGR
jgi:hypothetical protein